MFALLALLAGYNVWARKVLVRRMLAAPREPGTDILLGGGPVLIERGRERACLLVHGFMGTPADFGELPAALDESGWDVHAPLLPGHGTDPRRLAAVSAEETIAAVARHLTALRGRYRCVVPVGFSMGGALAMIVSCREGADGLVLVNPYFRSRYLARYVLPPRWWHRILSPFVGYVVRPRWMINVRRREAWPRIVCYRVIPARAFAEVFAIADRARQCAAPGAPMLMLVSQKDRTASARAAREFHGRVQAPAARLVEFARSDHMLFWDYDREEAVRAVVEFLNGLPGPGAGGNEK